MESVVKSVSCWLSCVMWIMQDYMLCYSVTISCGSTNLWTHVISPSADMHDSVWNMGTGWRKEWQQVCERGLKSWTLFHMLPTADCVGHVQRWHFDWPNWQSIIVIVHCCEWWIYSFLCWPCKTMIHFREILAYTAAVYCTFVSSVILNSSRLYCILWGTASISVSRKKKKFYS